MHPCHVLSIKYYISSHSCYLCFINFSIHACIFMIASEFQFYRYENNEWQFTPLQIYGVTA